MAAVLPQAGLPPSISADRIQDAWCDPVQADEDQTIKIAEDRTLGRASTQHVQLMTQS
jgi:hypothetical protein